MQIVGERGLNALLPDTDKLKQTDLVFTQSLISGTIISQSSERKKAFLTHSTQFPNNFKQVSQRLTPVN